MSGASERANGRASGPVLTSVFLVDPDHSGAQQSGQMGANIVGGGKRMNDESELGGESFHL